MYPNDALERVEEVVATSRRLPLTTRVMVDGEALAGAMADLRAALAGQSGHLDAYLRDIADALDDLRRDGNGDGDGATALPVTAAATAGLQPILSAAETTAQQLREQADADAARTREEAEREAESVRAAAAADAAEQLRQAEHAAARVDELTEAASIEMQSMLEGLRGRGLAVGKRLGSVLEELEELGAGAPATAVHQVVVEEDGENTADDDYAPEAGAPEEPAAFDEGALHDEPAARPPAEFLPAEERHDGDLAAGERTF